MKLHQKPAKQSFECLDPYIIEYGSTSYIIWGPHFILNQRNQ